jgi:hypothetical protein
MLEKLFDKLLKLVSDERGDLSPSKLASLTAHLVVATVFLRQEWDASSFNENRWMLYIGATILHAGYDRTVDTIRALKTGRQVAGDQPTQGN